MGIWKYRNTYQLIRLSLLSLFLTITVNLDQANPQQSKTKETKLERPDTTLPVDDDLELSILDTLNDPEHSKYHPGKPAPPGMELLAVNPKKTKFTYFDTTQSYKRVIDTKAFKVGEKLEFIIRYGPIVAGTATMAIPNIKTVNNFECLHIQSIAKSNSFFSAFFKVEDRVESYMDHDGLYSWRFEKHLREGNYKADQYVNYDHINRIAVTNKKDTLRIPPCVQDILTAFYYVRTLPLEIGNSVFIDSHADRKLYPLEVKVHKKERIKVRAGKFNCIVVEPMLRSDAIFKQRGRLKIWLTDDVRRIPVQMKSKVLIGSITAELEKMKGTMPANDSNESQ